MVASLLPWNLCAVDLWTVSFVVIELYFFNFLIRGKLLYRVMLVSAIQQCELVLIVYVYPLPPEPPSPSQPSPLGHHRVSGWSPCLVQQLPTKHLLYTGQCMLVSATYSICATLSFPSCVRKSVLYIILCMSLCV